MSDVLKYKEVEPQGYSYPSFGDIIQVRLNIGIARE